MGDHLNSNVLCAFNLETKNGKLHKVEVQPITLTMEPHPRYRPFHVELGDDGIPPSDAADFFDAWAGEFHFPPNKRISPLGYNWTREVPLLRNWLGNATYEFFIDGRCRDFTACHTYQCDKIYRKEKLVLTGALHPLSAMDLARQYYDLLTNKFVKVHRDYGFDTVCVIDTETTGINPSKFEIIQLCIIPVDSDWNVRRDIIPFDIEIKPTGDIDPEALKKNKLDILRIMQTGMENDTAQDLLGCWFAKLQTLGAFKIVPLAHNWTFDASFINKFLGAGYDHLFTDFCRDTMSACLFENDFAYTNSSRIPFPKVNLPYIASQLVIEHGRAHTALGDCLTTLEVYKELIKGRLPSGANSLLGAL